MIDRTPKPESSPSARERVGVSLVLLLVWLWFEYGRPANPLGIPLLISAALLVGWIFTKERRWSPQSSLFVAFLLVMAVGIPLAANTYSAFWSTYAMATTLLCICVPLPSLVNSIRKVRLWIYTFVAVAVYVGGWALFHGGYGPAGAGGGQDENYVATMMGMAVPAAYFSIFAEKRRFVKMLLALSIAVFFGATIVGANPSRGGFLGLCAVLLYILARSPRRLIGIVIISVILVVVLPFAGPRYWTEMTTIQDIDEGTADLRLEIWTNGVRMWQANPILGVGAGNFRWMVGVYQSSEQLEKFGRDLGGSVVAHSLFVELIAEFGTAGALVLLALLWRTTRDLWLVIQQAKTRPQAGGTRGDSVALRCYADAAIGAMIACLVNGVFLSLLYFSYLWVFMALGVAVVQVSRAHMGVPHTEAHPRPAGRPSMRRASAPADLRRRHG